MLGTGQDPESGNETAGLLRFLLGGKGFALDIMA